MPHKTEVLSTSWVSFIAVYEIGGMLVDCLLAPGLSLRHFKEFLGREGGSENQAPGCTKGQGQRQPVVLQMRRLYPSALKSFSVPDTELKVGGKSRPSYYFHVSL